MTLKKYISIMRGGFLEGCAFRKHLFSSLVANFFQLFALFFVWQSVFRYQDVINGYTWSMMRQYVFISYLCNSTFSFGFENEMSKKIIRGDIIIELLKPVSYRSMTFFRMFGSAVIEFNITLIIIGSLFIIFNGFPDISFISLITFFLALMCGIIIKFEIQFLVSTLCFYTDNSYGIVKGRIVISNILSGAILPLAMFPDIFKNVISILPFQYIVYFPCQIFIGELTWQDIAQKFCIQLLWIAVLRFMGSFAWEKASRKITLYGG